MQDVFYVLPQPIRSSAENLALAVFLSPKSSPNLFLYIRGAFTFTRHFIRRYFNVETPGMVSSSESSFDLKVRVDFRKPLRFSVLNLLPWLPSIVARSSRPLSVVLPEVNEEVLIRHLTLFDLVVIGVAGTIGTGVFAIVGLIGSSCKLVGWLVGPSGPGVSSRCILYLDWDDWKGG